MASSRSLAPEATAGGLLRTRRGRLTLFFVLYLAEGLPIGLCMFALSAYLRRSGAAVSEVGLFISALLAPWTLKWLWAPLVDLIRPERFGPNRTWIVFTQTMMTITLAVLFFVDPAANLGLLSACMVVHNVFAATQDVAIDGFAVRVLPESEMAWANGFMFAGQHLGMAIGGGGALYVAGLYGFNAAFAIVLVALASIVVGVSLRIQEGPEHEPSRARDSWAAALLAKLRTFFRELFVGFFQSGPGPRVGVLFAVMPMGAMALAFGISSALQVDLGFSEGQMSASTTATLLSSAVGCAAAGWLGDRFGIKPVLAAAHVVTVVPTLYLGYAVHAGGLGSVTYSFFLACAIVHRLGLGLMYGVTAGVFMSMTNPAVGATQFTGYNSLRNVALAYSAYWQGAAVSALGYGHMFGLDALFGLVPIALIPFLRASRVRNPNR